MSEWEKMFRKRYFNVQLDQTDKHTWRLFDVRYENVDERPYTFYLRAPNRQMAHILLGRLKETATLVDQMTAIVGFKCNLVQWLQPEVKHAGYTWYLFEAKYGFTNEDTYDVFYFYALSYEHASYLLEDIKQNATLNPDDVIGIEPTGE